MNYYNSQQKTSNIKLFIRKKVEEFNAEIQAQIKENKESVSRMANAVKFFTSEIGKKKREFKSYAHGFLQGLY